MCEGVKGHLGMDLCRKRESESCALVLDLVSEVCIEGVIKGVRCVTKQVTVTDSSETPSHGAVQYIKIILHIAGPWQFGKFDIL